MAILSYDVNFKTAGRYYVWVRAFSTDGNDNSIHVGLNDEWPETGNKLFICEDLFNKWSWSSTKFNGTERCVSKKRVYIDVEEPGFQKVMFSMLEDGFEFDKFLLTKNQFYKPD